MLQRLALSECRGLTAAVLPRVLRRPLESLDVQTNPWLDDRAVGVIAKQSGLRSLGLGGCPISDAGLARLASLRNLEQLNLRGCRGITAKGLERLAPLPLRHLDIYRAPLERDEIERLAGAWPGCEILMPNAMRYRVPR